ncbi:MAG: alpha/beta fold hydrolase [Proteobacteria bacterium]|nr:alpha/beta fold hydrolase [Pseudomonadota bacterium]
MDFALKGGGHLHVHNRPGNARRIVFVHGWAVTGGLWNPVFERWAGAETLLAPDLQGTGWSSKPTTGYTLAQHASDVAELIASGSGPVTLVGHSMGGAIAQLVAVEHPELVERLILVSPVPASGVPLAEEDRAYFRSLRGKRTSAAVLLDSMIIGDRPDGFDAIHDSMATVTEAAFLEGFEAWTGANFADRLSELTLPVHVMGGSAEQPLSPAVLMATVVGPIAGATFDEIPGVGHYPHIETPEAFTTMLEDRAAS